MLNVLRTPMNTKQIKNFNALFAGLFRVAKNKDMKDFWYIEQWCPQAEVWSKHHNHRWNWKSENSEEMPKYVWDSVEEESKSPTSKIIVLKGKHFDRHYKATTTEDIGLACLEIIENRHSQDWYTSTRNFDEVEKILKTRSYQLATIFMKNEGTGDFEIIDLLEPPLKAQYSHSQI